MKIFEHLKEKYLTWRTGKSKDERDWEAWYNTNVVYTTSNITNMFMHFEHVIIVDHEKFFQFDPFTWVPCEEAKQYFWPARPLGENCVWRFERVRLDHWDNRWYLDDFGEDKVFVATNNGADATMLALMFA
jgi:hypothetical protein